MLPKPYLYLAIALAWIASLAAVGLWQHHAGTVGERTLWQAREADELRQANATIAQLQTAYRATERRHADLMATISATYQEQLTNATDQHTTDLAALRAGTLRLRDRAARQSPACDRVPETTAAAGGRDGDPGTELSGAAAEFLLGLTNRANRIVEQLTACQAIVRADRARD